MIGCSGSKDQVLPEILKKGSARFQQTLANPDYEIQIIYGRITADTIMHEAYNVDPDKFFYPASTAKMPVAFAALQKLGRGNLSLDSRILIDSSEHNPRRLIYDSLFSQEPTVRNLVTKIFTFSDNQAYNVLYGWLGKDYINNLNQRIGLPSSRLIHQLSESAFSFTSESNRNTSQATLIDEEKRIAFAPFQKFL